MIGTIGFRLAVEVLLMDDDFLFSLRAFDVCYFFAVVVIGN